MIVVVGGVMMIFVTPPLQFKLQTGFITSKEAKDIVHEPESKTANFVVLKYTGMSMGGCSIMMYPYDPYSKQIIGNASQISLPCFPTGFPNKIDVFAWVIDTTPSSNCRSSDYVNAKTGEHIGGGMLCLG